MDNKRKAAFPTVTIKLRARATIVVVGIVMFIISSLIVISILLGKSAPQDIYLLMLFG